MSRPRLRDATAGEPRDTARGQAAVPTASVMSSRRRRLQPRNDGRAHIVGLDHNGVRAVLRNLVGEHFGTGERNLHEVMVGVVRCDVSSPAAQADAGTPANAQLRRTTQLIVTETTAHHLPDVHALRSYDVARRTGQPHRTTDPVEPEYARLAAVAIMA